MQWIGALCLLLGASVIGFGAEHQLKAHATSLRSLKDGLAWMERELSFRLTPLPDLLDQLIQQANQPACLFFYRCKQGMAQLGEQTMGEIWRQALEAEPELLLQPQEQAILVGLGEVLGRYDSQGQAKALEETVVQLQHCLEEAGTEHKRLGNLYRMLGMGAGALLVILLL